MKEVLVATGNRGKLRELELLLSPYVEKVYSLAAFPDVAPAVEDGRTFAENAIKKATAAAQATGKPSIADDSGLVVEELDGAPGVFSARFAGEGATDAENNAKLLQVMTGISSGARQASFRCAAALCVPGKEPVVFKGELKGVILEAPRGTEGFGYDPLFLIPEYGKTLAELPIEVKNRISHRSMALGKVIQYIGNCKES